jgi:D-alanyl-D-alanine dipeptidase
MWPIPPKAADTIGGIAADLTIINLKNGEELNMGTGFDNFTDSAHQTYIHLPTEVLQNRLLLRTIMEKNGFKALETEWWHYFLAEGDSFELLDIDFKKLGQRL